jgi:copper chaperone CopZ
LSLAVQGGRQMETLLVLKGLGKPCHDAQVSIKGMHCSSCSSAVEHALSSQPGVLSASVALLKETAEVRYSRRPFIWETIMFHFNLDMQYEVRAFPTEYDLPLQVVFNDGDITVSEILKVIQNAGFTAELLQKHDEGIRHEVLLHCVLGV